MITSMQVVMDYVDGDAQKTVQMNREQGGNLSISLIDEDGRSREAVGEDPPDAARKLGIPRELHGKVSILAGVMMF